MITRRLQSRSSLHELDVHVPQTADLMVELYRAALYEFADRPAYKKNGEPARWGLDLRRPLGRGDLLGKTSTEVAQLVDDLGFTQIAGKGVAGALLVAGILAVRPLWTGGVIREQRKAYGFREIVEGALTRDRPVVLVDDVLASGKTLFVATEVLRAEGYCPVVAVPLFQFAWHQGTRRLGDIGLEVLPVGTLRYRGKRAPRSRVVFERQTQEAVRWDIQTL
jgi:orotate phosphoribosyltransferase